MSTTDPDYDEIDLIQEIAAHLDGRKWDTEHAPDCEVHQLGAYGRC